MLELIVLLIGFFKLGIIPGLIVVIVGLWLYNKKNNLTFADWFHKIRTVFKR